MSEPDFETKAAGEAPTSPAPRRPAGGDYIAKTGTLTFALGETTKTITIWLRSNASFTKNRSLGTILKR